jgi:hypothetical protein
LASFFFRKIQPLSHEVTKKENTTVERFSPAAGKKTARVIEIETFGARFRNWPLLGFTFRNNIGKM